MKILYTILLVMLTGIGAYAQSTTSKRALRAYNNMLYAEAAKLYQEVVDKTGGSQEELLNLADSYLKLQQFIDAELTFERLFQANPAQSQKVILKYAQALAQNERYEESLRYYEKYTADERGKKFAEAYREVNKFYRDSSLVSVAFLPVNTIYSEYSPCIYKKGLVFCSNRNRNTGIKRVYGWNQTPYSDIYYTSDASSFYDMWVADNSLPTYRKQLTERKSIHDFTPATSNDNRTIGHYTAEDLGGEDGDQNSIIDVSLFNSQINSRYHEGSACFSKNFDTIFFTRNSFYKGKTTKGSDDVTRLQIFFATLSPSGKFENVQPFPFNNPEYSVGHPALSPDGRRLYFVSDKKGGVGETDIYYSEIREHRFTDPVSAGPIVNTPGSEMFPSFNKDGSMFFSSDGHAGLGGLDIFRSDFINNEFQTPENLRYPINSSKDDFGVTSSDLKGTRGYLTSNRIRGRADDNIYAYTDNRPQRVLLSGIVKVKHTDENGKVYIEPIDGAEVTLAPYGDKVITSRNGRFEFMVDRGKAYSIEAAKDKLGKDRKEIDLVKASDKKHSYSMELLLDMPSPAIAYTGKVLDEQQTPVKNAAIYLYDVESVKSLKLETDSEGQFMTTLQPNHTYLMKCNAESYFSDCYKIQVPSNATMQGEVHTIMLKQIQMNSTFEVKNLFYDYKKSEIKPESAEVLDKMVRFLRDNPDIVVELGSHTDARGSDDYNQKLSAERAKAAVNYIVAKGIDSSRITAKGYGETELLNECKNNTECTEEQHQQNRRTEIKITGMLPKETLVPTESLPDPNADPQNVFKSLSDFNDCKVIRVGN